MVDPTGIEPAFAGVNSAEVTVTPTGPPSQNDKCNKIKTPPLFSGELLFNTSVLRIYLSCKSIKSHLNPFVNVYNFFVYNFV